jgi:hypothetical protein
VVLVALERIATAVAAVVSLLLREALVVRV